MGAAARTVIGVLGLLHIYIAWMEIFAWTTRGPNVFTDFPPELFADTTQLAANQGIYNAFLAAGLLYALFVRDRKLYVHFAACFLIFVAVAGIFGAATVVFKIFFIQTVPAAIGLVLLYLSEKTRDDA